MAEPRILYATTKDGVSIAYFAMGEGIPVILTPPIPYSHLQMELDDPGYRAWYERLAQNKRIVRYDNRGSGLSDRNVEITLESLELDILAVADKLGLEKFVLVGISIGSPATISFAAHHPERVTQLVLWCGFASADASSPQAQALNLLQGADWNLFTETVAHATVAGWGSSDEASRFAKLMRASVERETAGQIDYLAETFDISSLLPEIRCPVLVLHRKQATFPDMDGARRLAAALLDAQLVVLEGGALLPWVGNMDDMIGRIDDFLGLETVDAEPQATAVAKPPISGMVTILFTDIEGSTTLTQNVGDAAAQTVVRAHNAIVREALSANGGSETKHTGDGIMASFPLTSSAIEAAIAIQRAVAAHSEAHPETAFRVRIGLNAGEPVVEEQDMFGTAVQLARRVCDHGEAGSILVTVVVRQLAAGKRYLFSDTGEATLRGFEDPVRLYEVSWM